MSSAPFPILSAALLSLLCLGVPSGGSRAEAPAAFDDEEILSVRYPDWCKQSFLDLPEDADIAAEAGKQGLFLFFTTEALRAQPGAGAGGGRDPAIGALAGRAIAAVQTLSYRWREPLGPSSC